MGDGIFVVQTNAVEGRDAEFNAWYDTVHIPELIDRGIFTGATRFECEPSGDDEESPRYRYLAVYTFDGEAADAAAALVRAVPSLSWTDSIDADRSLVAYRAMPQQPNRRP
jgi:hypothetical protein